MKSFLTGIVLIFVIVTSVWALDVTLQWDPNSEADLAGYKVYYGSQSGVTGEFSGCTPSTPHPYHGTEANEGPSPITYYITGTTPIQLSDPAHPEITLTNIPDDKGTYYVVTAFDFEGLESNFSNEVFTIGAPLPDTTPPAIPIDVTIEQK